MNQSSGIGFKVKTIEIVNFILFLVSPVLTLPTILIGIYNKNKLSLILFLIFASLIMYQLVPFDNMDLYEFYRFYKDVKHTDIKGFFIEITDKADFIVYLIIYVCAKIGISGQVVFSILTFITLYFIYLVFNKIQSTHNVSKKFYLIGIISVFISFELLGLYSGVRNMLASSTMIYSFYLGLFEKKTRKSLIFLLLSALTHFGILLFIPVYFFILIKPIKQKTILIIYLISFAFLFLTKDYLYHLAMAVPTSETIENKIKSYLLGLDFIEKDNLKSNMALISFKIRMSWIYFAHAYIFLTHKRQSAFRNLVILLLCLLNIFSVSPDIHIRLTYLIEPMFIYLLYHEYVKKNNKVFIQLFFIFLIPSFVVNIMVYRDYFMSSLLNKEFLTLIGILMKEVELIFRW